MQWGKHKCNQLKAVRKRIADENGIPLKQKECTYDGPCRGTCPYCEAEMRYLERMLTHRLRLGKVATVAGLSLGLAACNGPAPTETPLLTSDSSLTSDTLPMVDTTPSAEDTVYAGIVTHEPPPPPIPPPTGGIDEVIVTGQMEEGGIEEYIEGEIEEDITVFTVVDEDPSFPGGMDSLYAWLANNIQYPKTAREYRIVGTVYVTFIVERDGSISYPKILRDIGGGCGKEVLRLVRMMPKWNPGKQRGETVRVQFNLPVKFQLE